MDKKPLIVVSICAVVLLVMGSLSNVVGYQTVQTSQQNTIKERINQRELLFQTIVDIANNKEIQRVILKSQINRGTFPTSEIPVITKQQIRQMYFIGLILSKIISKSRIQSMVQQYQFNNQEIQKEISAVIEKDTTLNLEITQLKNSECDCDNEESIGTWKFPAICVVLLIIEGLIVIPSWIVFNFFYGYPMLYSALEFIYSVFIFVDWWFAAELDCFWWRGAPGLLS
jgi:hypothetical protein